MSRSSDEIRVSWKAGDAIRDAGLTTPEDILRFDNIRYGEHPSWNLLDVYRPKSAGEETLPVILNVHGGAWVYGDKDLYQFYCMSLARRGFAVINFSYRLAPEYRFPAELEDTVRVVGWMYENADRYGLDTEHIFVTGDSAGAQIAAQLCALTTDPGFASHFSFRLPEQFAIAGVCFNCGAYHLYDCEKEAFAAETNPDLMQDLFEDGGSPDEMRLMNVEDLVNEHFPPAFIVTARGDFLRAQFPHMVSAYERAGLSVMAKIYGTKDNPLYHVFMVDVKNPAAALCTDEECGFFRSLIGGKMFS